MVRLYSLLAGLALVGTGAASIGLLDHWRSVGGLLDLIVAGLLLCALLLFRADDRYLRQVVELLALVLLAKASVFYLAAAVGYVRAPGASITLFYAGNLVLGVVGVAIARLHARRREAESP